jgi:anti-anti-sigma factor
MMPTPQLLEIERQADAVVVRFVHRTLLESEAIEAVSEQLTALARDGCRKIVLDFARVESLTSSMLGQFVSLHQQVQANGGRLAFCQVQPFLLRLFTLFNLPDLIPIYDDENEALQHL